MELRQLRLFLALADQRNFGRAAERMNLTQQALSHSIAQLEKSLNAKLFERGAFGAELTEVGRAFEKRARIICAEVELAGREVEALNEGADGQVTLGVTTSVASTLLPEVIERFARIHPRVRLVLSVDHSRILYDRLANGDLDVVVATPATDPHPLIELTHERIEGFELDANFLVMRPSHPLLQKHDRTLSDLVLYPWILPATFSDFSRALFDLFSANGLTAPAYILRTDSFRGGTALVMQTDFLALTGREPASVELSVGLLAGFPLPGFEARQPGYISHRQRVRLQPAAQILVRTFRSVVDERAQRLHATK